LQALADTNIRDIITLSIEHKAPARALIVHNTGNGLTDILVRAYKKALPEARCIDFDSVSKEVVIETLDSMSPGDLVVLVQTSNFLLDAFRIRLHLFSKKLKVIEHMHLYRNSEDVWDVYINALAYDPHWYRDIGPRLQAVLAKTKTLTIKAGASEVTVEGGLENPKPNLGDYRGMENVGGTFPIGEVFTEAKKFEGMRGSFMVYAFAGGDFCVHMHEPFRVDVENGIVVSCADNTPQAFTDILSTIKEYERPLIREIGFGLNRAITRERYLQDITAFERIYGMHLSLGEKHSVFKKDGMTTNKTKFHVDLFPVVDTVLCDGVAIFESGKYVV
jgi:hypothetical protein